MELAPVPRRPRLATRGRILLGVAVLMPITLFALLPAVLGLQRYVVADDSVNGGIDRGSLVIERSVPASDLHVGDVITFRASSSNGGPLVTRRIVRIQDDTAYMGGDAEDGTGLLTLDLSSGTRSRVLMHVPWVGYPFVAGVGRTEGMVLLIVPLLAFAITAAAEESRRRHGRRSATVTP